MSQLFFGNAIGWVHFRLLGGWKSVGWITVAFIAAAIGALIVPPSLVRMAAPALQGGSLNTFVGFELVLAALVAPGLTSAAIRRDITSRMIESHRLMPVSNTEAIVGYIVGPNAISLALFLATMLCGSVAAAIVGIPIPRLLIASAIIISFGAFATTLAAFGAAEAGNAGGIWLILIVVPAVVVSASSAQAVPAIAVFCSPLMRKTVFSMQAGVDEPLAYVISASLQALAAIILFNAAGRRYRSNEFMGVSALHALVPAGIWLAASAIGIRRWDLFYWQAFSADRPDRFLQCATATSVGLFLAAQPMLLNNRARFIWKVRRRLVGDLIDKAPFCAR